MSILLQYNTALPVEINADMGKFFGITNIPALYSAGVMVAQHLVQICGPVVGLALLIKLLTLVTKIFNDKAVDFFDLGKTLFLMLFLFQYVEIMTQVNSLISYFTDNVQFMFDKYGSGHTVVDKVNEVYDKYQQTHPDPGVFGAISNIGDWIIVNCTHLIIVIARAIIYVIRSLLMVFLFAVGPIAILASMFPGYEKNLEHWFKYYVSIGFWAVTLAVLDLLLYQYLEDCEKRSTIEGMPQMNIGIALMYLIGPYLTSRFIGGQSSQFMSKMVQMSTTALAMSTRVGKGTSQALSFSGANSMGISAAGRSGGTLSGSSVGETSNSVASRAGRAYGGIKNNVIRRNKSE